MWQNGKTDIFLGLDIATNFYTTNRFKEFRASIYFWSFHDAIRSYVFSSSTETTANRHFENALQQQKLSSTSDELFATQP